MHNTLKALHLNAVAGCYLSLRQNLSLGRGCALCFDADRASHELRVAGRVTMSGCLVDAKPLWIPMVAFWMVDMHSELKERKLNHELHSFSSPLPWSMAMEWFGRASRLSNDFNRCLFAVVIQQIVYKALWTAWLKMCPCWLGAHDPILSLDSIALRKITWELWKGM